MPKKRIKKSPKEKTFREPLAAGLKEEIRSDLAKDGFNVEAYNNHYLRLENKLEYYDVTLREGIGTYETVCDMLQSSLNQIKKIRQDPNSNVARREKTDPFYRSGLKEYVSGITYALNYNKSILGNIRKSSTAENVLLDDLWEDGFEIEKLETNIYSGWELVEKHSNKRGDHLLAAMINDIETAIFQIEKIRADASSRTSKREETAAKYGRGLDNLVLRLRHVQKDLKRSYNPDVARQ